jgi:hypothetical protein
MTDRTDAAVDMRNEIKKDIRSLWCRLRDLSWSIIQHAGNGRALSTPAMRLPLDLARSGVASTPHVVAPAAVKHDTDDAVQSGILLQFPVHGEALLVKLADRLRLRLASGGAERDPLLLTMSRCPGSRLSIDSSAYVEFDADRSAYQVVIEAATDTRITLDTTDFDAVVNFVLQYIVERPTELAALEMVAS